MSERREKWLRDALAEVQKRREARGDSGRDGIHGREEWLEQALAELEERNATNTQPTTNQDSNNMNNQFCLCYERDIETGKYYGMNLNAIESFWLQKKTENQDTRITVHFRDHSVELTGGNAEWLLKAMKLPS